MRLLTYCPFIKTEKFHKSPCHSPAPGNSSARRGRGLSQTQHFLRSQRLLVNRIQVRSYTNVVCIAKNFSISSFRSQVDLNVHYRCCGCFLPHPGLEVLFTGAQVGCTTEREQMHQALFSARESNLFPFVALAVSHMLTVCLTGSSMTRLSYFVCQ